MFRSTHSFRRKPLFVFVQVALPTMLAMSMGHAATCTVNSSLDDPADASAKVSGTDPATWTNWGAGATGAISLRDCIVAANLMTGATGAPSGTMAIDTSSIANSTIALGDSLPMIFNNTTIGGSGNPVTIDGGGAHRIFFVSGLPDSTQNFNSTGVPDPDGAQTVAASLSNLILQNGKAQGGSGNAGGMGAGGAVFVNKNATVTLNQVDVKTNAAIGGGAVASTGNAVYGGGGMGGNSTARGAGGIGGNAGSSTGGGIGTNSASGGGGFGGTGVGQLSSSQGFTSPAFGGGASFSAVDGGIGGGGYRYGLGGFGGGGGNCSGGGINGGFGGGGGAPGEGGGGCDGGFGGGGGNMGPSFDSFRAAGATGPIGAVGGFGAGGAGGGGGEGCFIGASGGTGGSGPFPGGSGGAGGPGGVGGGIGAVGVDGGGCSGYGSYGTPGTPGAGGGGGGLGGGVFVRAGGTLQIQSNSQTAGGSAVSGNTVTAGAGGAPGATGAAGGNGAAAGAGMFLMGGTTTTFDIGTTETISDNIQDDSSSSLFLGQSYTSGSGAGAAITKKGAGTLIFGSGAVNTYAGVTTINGGTLQLDGFLSASPIMINSGGMLSGTGGSAQSVTLNNGGVIAPGDSPGTLSGSNLTWNGDGTDQMGWQLGADSTPANTDLLVLNSNLNKGTGTTFKFHFTDGGGGAPTPGTTYTLIRYNATTFALDASEFTFDYSGALAGGLKGTFALTGSAAPPPAPIHSAPTAGLPPNALTFAAAALPPTIAKAFSPTSIPLNGVTTLTFNLGNPNANIALSNIAFSDSLPAGLAVASTPNASNTCGGTFAPAASATSLTFSGGALAISATCAISVDVQGTTAGVKNNTSSSITSTESLTAGGTPASASVTVIAPPTIAKGFVPNAIGPSGASTLTFTINNPNASALSGVTFTDTFPAGLEVAATPNATDTCGGTFTAVAAAGSVSLTGGSVAATASCTLTVDVHGTTTGTKNNTTGVISSTEGGTGGTASASLTVNVTPVRLQSFDVE